MEVAQWFSELSARQRLWLFGAAVAGLVLVGVGLFAHLPGEAGAGAGFSVDMTIGEMAPRLDVTGKALAREFSLPLDVSKRVPVATLGVTQDELEHVTGHLLSHRDATLKYYVFVALVLFGVVFLVRLGRPDRSDPGHRQQWYPRAPYVTSLMLSVIAAGFLLGKSPNPMEGVVKVFKSMVGLYPDPAAKVAAFLFFVALAVVGNKVICGWACPFGSLQELIYSIPVLRGVKRRKLPFVITNVIRASVFVGMLLFLFGLIGGRRGMVIYHYVNPFGLFNLDFETISITVTIAVALLAASFAYRPFCQLICPFGFMSWMLEKVSVFRVRVDPERCTECGACIGACPLEAAEGIVYGKKLSADCFSCARCLNVCPVDAIRYGSGARGDRVEEIR
jgi:ferredoxin